MSDVHETVESGAGLIPASYVGRLPRFTVYALITVLLVVIGMVSDTYYLHIGILTWLAIVMSVSLRPLTVSGEASFCHGTFYALGAYTVGILTTDLNLPVLLAVLLGGFVALLGAFIIGLPSLRTSGSYFFLMTFGFLVVVNSLIQSATGLTGGFSGISGIPSPAGVGSDRQFYFFAGLFMMATVVIFVMLDRSRWGLHLKGLGDSVELAESVGVNRFRNMMGAFGVGAFFTGIGGGIYATYVSFISPSSFSFWVSVYALTAVIIGGTRYVTGAILGAFAFNILPLAGNWSEAYVGIFVAAATLAILLLAPSGLTHLFVRLGNRRGLFTEPPMVRPTDVDTVSSGPPTERDATVVSRDSNQHGTADHIGPVLEIRAVSKKFGGLNALTDVSFNVMRGETVGIIGPNGAGKTTLFNVISGFERPTAGEVLLHGSPVTRLGPTRIVKLGLTRTFQATNVFDELTVAQNVLYAADRSTGGMLGHAFIPVGNDREALRAAWQILELFELAEWANERAGELPYGLRKTLGVAIAMATEPDMLCLDEPMAGLAEQEVVRMAATLELLQKRSDLSLLIIEHRVGLMQRLCDRLIALNFGRVIASGVSEDVIADPVVVTAYMGSKLEVGNGS